LKGNENETSCFCFWHTRCCGAGAGRVQIKALIDGSEAASFFCAKVGVAARRWMLWLFLCAVAIFDTGLGHAGQLLEGRVVSIADGDTITILDAKKQQHRVRLKGIDAPERRQAFGGASKQNLATLVARQTVQVRVDDTDRFGRIIGVVFVRGSDINLEMVRRGMAWHYRQFARNQTPAERAAYVHAEQKARAARLGLWSDPNPLAPWDFRRP